MWRIRVVKSEPEEELKKHEAAMSRIPTKPMLDQEVQEIIKREFGSYQAYRNYVQSGQLADQRTVNAQADARSARGFARTVLRQAPGWLPPLPREFLQAVMNSHYPRRLPSVRGARGYKSLSEGQGGKPTRLHLAPNRFCRGLGTHGPFKRGGHFEHLRPLDQKRKEPGPRTTRRRHHGGNRRKLRRSPNPNRLINVYHEPTSVQVILDESEPKRP